MTNMMPRINRKLSLALLVVFLAAPMAQAASREEIDAETAKRPIIGFIFPNEGLMYNLTFEGSNITEITK